MWIDGAALDNVHPKPSSQNRKYYHSHVGGQLVLPTIRQAIDFLLSDPVATKLDYV